ncbi:MAG: hypothetical protein Q9170_002162 [Blastenia crenularia]
MDDDERFEDIIHRARRWYAVDEKPEFVQEKKGISCGSRKEVLLPDPEGNFPTDPDAPRTEIIAEEWNQKFFYWTMLVDGELCIVKPYGRAREKVPYQRWRGIRYAGFRNGFADQNLAFNLPAPQSSRSSARSPPIDLEVFGPRVFDSNASSSFSNGYEPSPELPGRNYGSNSSDTDSSDLSDHHGRKRRRASMSNNTPNKRKKYAHDPEVDGLEPSVQSMVDEARQYYHSEKPPFLQSAKGVRGTDSKLAYFIGTDGKETRKLITIEKRAWSEKEIFWVAWIQGEQKILHHRKGGVGGSSFYLWQGPQLETDRQQLVARPLTTIEYNCLNLTAASPSLERDNQHTSRLDELSSAIGHGPPRAKPMPQGFQPDKIRPVVASESRSASVGERSNAIDGNATAETEVPFSTTDNNTMNKQPAGNEQGSSSTSMANGQDTPARLSSRSCTECRRKKIRCDRSLPKCGRCQKARAECSYVGKGSRAKAQRTANAAPSHLVNELRADQLHEAGSRSNIPSRPNDHRNVGSDTPSFTANKQMRAKMDDILSEEGDLRAELELHKELKGIRKLDEEEISRQIEIYKRLDAIKVQKKAMTFDHDIH